MITSTFALFALVLIATGTAVLFFTEWKRAEDKVAHYRDNVIPAYQERLGVEIEVARNNFNKASEHFNLFLAEKKAREASELLHWDLNQCYKLSEQRVSELEEEAKALRVTIASLQA